MIALKAKYTPWGTLAGWLLPFLRPWPFKLALVRLAERLYLYSSSCLAHFLSNSIHQEVQESETLSSL
jgi:hypothetical protein